MAGGTTTRIDTVTNAERGQSNTPKFSLQLGVFAADFASGTDQMEAVQRLRAMRFRAHAASGDLDRFDALSEHLMITVPPDRAAIGVARLRILTTPEDILSCYSGQFYDLAELARSGRRLVEVGRICIDENHAQDVDVARVLLASLARITSDYSADMLIGCASFPGAEPARHRNALNYLFDRHPGPANVKPGRRAGLNHVLTDGDHTPQATDLREVPALLRLYLGLGGWVSDHAICDHDLDTVHVFTAVEVASIPRARMRALKALARDDVR
ncbi:GNAT family N-acetyltransferase [Roseinatronobacter bogoriensis]|uniref:L-ornithine N(alpha)-acyltransferase n=1 Tax=Roseinatronobacter bogoriensis subsp. barguzinensis TaxID=441209 RepID=A0A2K8KAU6_9RHOB|nr:MULTISPECIES: GNAT family N-acetyltransferase [Rhodobaca]ATX66562.1 GNAT family N-acetyltransferase [Rhodobaca barguzinensis]